MPHTLPLVVATVSAILAAGEPQPCSRIFRKALATFDVDTFACGEADLDNLERLKVSTRAEAIAVAVSLAIVAP
jgi:hypothetical protein